MLEKAKHWVKLVLLCFCPAIIYKFRQSIRKYCPLINEEINSPVKVSLPKRLWAWKHGFLSKCTMLYGLDKNNIHRYLPDAPYLLAHPLNGTYSSLIDNKAYLPFTLGEFREHLPVYHLLLYKNEMIPLNGRGPVMPQSQIEIILDLCREKGKLVMKPVNGEGGRDVHLMVFDAEGFHLDHKPIEEKELKSKCLSLNNFIVTEFVQQHPYAEAFFPHTANSLRILTARNYDVNEPFIGWVLQRIGRTSSIPVDNVAGGGIACAVNVASGEIGAGISFPRNSRPIWHERHPDTGVPIAGTLIPNWKEVSSKILEMAGYLAMVPYIGWDVVITEEGFKVLEMNSLPSINSTQVYNPILDDERMRRFYSLYIPSLQNRC
jgi:hypothetical protein